MSKISTIIDRIRVLVPTLAGFDAATKFELPNTYFLENNPDNLLANGWGMKFTAADLGPNQETKSLSEDHGLEMILTRELFQSDHDSLPNIIVIKQMKEQSLLLKQEFLSSRQLDIQASITKIDYIGSGEIEPVADKKNLLKLITNFTITINENY